MTSPNLGFSPPVCAPALTKRPRRDHAAVRIKDDRPICVLPRGCWTYLSLLSKPLAILVPSSTRALVRCSTMRQPLFPLARKTELCGFRWRFKIATKVLLVERVTYFPPNFLSYKPHEPNASTLLDNEKRRGISNLPAPKKAKTSALLRKCYRLKNITKSLPTPAKYNPGTPGR